MNTVLQQLLLFRKERSWKKFHTPQNIAQSIVLEAAEVLEIFQWKKDSKITPAEKSALAEELADVYNWVTLLSHDLKIDIEEEALKKIEKNKSKYPIKVFKGIAKKYTQV